MTAENPGGRGLPRRSLPALAVLALLAGCAADPAATDRVAANPAPPPSVAGSAAPATPAAVPSVSAPPSPSPSATTKAAAGRGGPVPFRAGRAMLGSYLSLGGKSLKESLALRRDQLGRDQSIVHVFYPWDGYVPSSEPAVARSSTLMVSWHGAPYAGINDGSSDRNIARVARKLAGMKRPILLRWGWEMNGDWFEWDGTHNGRDTAGYVKAWRRMHRIFREQGADNVAWVWSPNWNSGPNVSWNRFQRYYPGDDYVDWVGVSGYDFYNETPKTLFTAVCAAYGKRKPIILSETAAVDAGGISKAAWIAKLSSWVEDTPAVGAVVWFDTDTQEDSAHNFRFDTDRKALAAYRAMARSDRFSG
ncbi:glycosyl hydrolase [Actinoplanes sp. NPDC049118]|uniref:glycoside hydrolase family 26 protein n=1 Tax=Actinoplanes sp. NPDC049118 TaxID=3155769 RepID=UPI0033DA281C